MENQLSSAHDDAYPGTPSQDDMPSSSARCAIFADCKIGFNHPSSFPKDLVFLPVFSQ